MLLSKIVRVSAILGLAGCKSVNNSQSLVTATPASEGLTCQSELQELDLWLASVERQYEKASTDERAHLASIEFETNFLLGSGCPPKNSLANSSFETNGGLQLTDASAPLEQNARFLFYSTKELGRLTFPLVAEIQDGFLPDVTTDPNIKADKVKSPKGTGVYFGPEFPIGDKSQTTESNYQPSKRWFLPLRRGEEFIVPETSRLMAEVVMKVRKLHSDLGTLHSKRFAEYQVRVTPADIQATEEFKERKISSPIVFVYRVIWERENFVRNMTLKELYTVFAPFFSDLLPASDFESEDSKP